MGLLKPSFIPPRPQRELRELADEANRIQKVLEGGNIKLSSARSVLEEASRDAHTA